MWSLVADLYTPLLAGGVLWLAYHSGVARSACMILGWCLALIFIFSALEGQLQLWRSWGLDYSTHTAILLPFYQLLLVLSLLPLRQKSRALGWLSSLKRGVALLVALVSGVAYGGLMHHLDYHSPADMLTTLVSTYPLVWICFCLMPPLSAQKASPVI